MSTHFHVPTNINVLLYLYHLHSLLEDTSSFILARPIVSGKKKRRRKSSAGDQLASSPVGAGTPLVISHDTSSPPTSPAEKDVENFDSPEVSVRSFQFKDQIDSSDVERRSTSCRGTWSTTRLVCSSSSSSSMWRIHVPLC